MNMEDFARDFARKMEEVKKYVEGEDIKAEIGTEAVTFYKSSFVNEGFTDRLLTKWKDVKRSDKNSDWFGHSAQTGKFSAARTTAKILTGETSELRESIDYILTDRGVKIISDKEYAGVHQFGLKAKVYGKHEFTMPARPFMGKSMVLKFDIEQRIKGNIIKILKK
jgi:phage gpG-like protein